VFHFPNEEAAKIAVETAEKVLDKQDALFDRVIFNVFQDYDKGIYEELLG
jgi:O-acetyl-ADP-ribose deacetylase (regulator of RNase III)